MSIFCLALTDMKALFTCGILAPFFFWKHKELMRQVWLFKICWSTGQQMQNSRPGVKIYGGVNLCTFSKRGANISFTWKAKMCRWVNSVLGEFLWLKHCHNDCYDSIPQILDIVTSIFFFFFQGSDFQQVWSCVHYYSVISHFSLTVTFPLGGPISLEKNPPPPKKKLIYPTS